MNTNKHSRLFAFISGLPEARNSNIKNACVQAGIDIGGVGVGEVMQFISQRHTPMGVRENLDTAAKIKCEVQFTRIGMWDIFLEGKKSPASGNEHSRMAPLQQMKFESDRRDSKSINGRNSGGNVAPAVAGKYSPRTKVDLWVFGYHGDRDEIKGVLQRHNPISNNAPGVLQRQDKKLAIPGGPNESASGRSERNPAPNGPFVSGCAHSKF